MHAAHQRVSFGHGPTWDQIDVFPISLVLLDLWPSANMRIISGFVMSHDLVIMSHDFDPKYHIKANNFKGYRLHIS